MSYDMIIGYDLSDICGPFCSTKHFVSYGKFLAIKVITLQQNSKKFLARKVLVAKVFRSGFMVLLPPMVVANRTTDDFHHFSLLKKIPEPNKESRGIELKRKKNEKRKKRRKNIGRNQIGFSR